MGPALQALELRCAESCLWGGHIHVRRGLYTTLNPSCSPCEHKFPGCPITERHCRSGERGPPQNYGFSPNCGGNGCTRGPCKLSAQTPPPPRQTGKPPMGEVTASTLRDKRNVPTAKNPAGQKKGHPLCKTKGTSLLLFYSYLDCDFLYQRKILLILRN